jgi:hypothetical protein
MYNMVLFYQLDTLYNVESLYKFVSREVIEISACMRKAL